MFNQQLFNASGYLEKSQLITENVIDISALPPFLRALLTSDGTIKKSLESYFWEPVDVILTSQKQVTLECDEPILNLVKGNVVFNRKVDIIGAHSKQLYLKASSVFSVEKLPHELKKYLHDYNVNIGESIRRSGLSTYRDVIALNQCLTHQSENINYIERLYRIATVNLPMIKVTEHYPLTPYLC